MLRLRSRLAGEAGVSMIFVAMTMLILMGMAAIAIDWGGAVNERRQDQSAADVGSLAAVQFARPNPGCTSATCPVQAMTNGANEAIAVANATLDDPSLAAWTVAAECVAPPAGFTVSPISPCVAFDDNLQRAWVQVPQIEYPTTFGRILGSGAINTSAAAIAMAHRLNPGRLLPFVSPGSMVQGNNAYGCLKTTSSGILDWGNCADFTSTGNFGSADFFMYGDDVNDYTIECNGGTNSRLVANIARGVDHVVGTHPTGSGSGIEERPACSVNGAEPDMVQAQSGVGSNLDDGLTEGGSYYSPTSYPGRIEPRPGIPSTQVRNDTLDNRPLWDYLLPDSSVPPQCESGNFTSTDPVVLHNNMEQCVKTANGVIFSSDIADTGRFGFTPLMWENDFLTPGTTYHIEDYLPVFLDTTFYGCNASTCDIVHTPGIADAGICPDFPEFISCGLPGANNRSLQAVTAFLLKTSHLPSSAATPFPGADNQRSYSLIR